MGNTKEQTWVTVTADAELSLKIRTAGIITTGTITIIIGTITTGTITGIITITTTPAADPSAQSQAATCRGRAYTQAFNGSVRHWGDHVATEESSQPMAQSERRLCRPARVSTSAKFSTTILTSA